MQTVDPEALESFARVALESCGAPADTARTVAESLVAADLVGHSSHGVVRVPHYVDGANEGVVDPGATPTVEPTGAFHQVVGGAAFGQLTARRAVESLVETARDRGVAAVGIRDSGHLGRIGEWAERVADEGLVFASWVNLQGGSQRIAPHGTADRRLGTNPITFAVPTFDALPFDLVYDGATSQVAHGKIIERDGSGERLPDAWTIGESGEPVEQAAAFENGAGALLPLGGRTAGYKGFGLATMAELFAAIVGDGPVSTEPRQDWVGNGGAFLAIDPTVFTTRQDVETRVATLAAHLRSADPVDGAADVRLPGEVEFETARKHSSEGVPLTETVADDMRLLADSLGLVEALPASLR